MRFVFKYAVAALLSLTLFSCADGNKEYDVLIVGGGASGVTAGVQASSMGMDVLIIEELPWLGGMLTSAGVSATDGCYNLAGGLWGEFKSRLADYYGGLDSLKTGWVSNVQFEPSAGNRIFHEMCAEQETLTIWKETSVKEITRTADGEWKIIAEQNGKSLTVNAKILIDATELGDVAKACGVKYDIGMENRSVTGEPIAPEQANNIVQDLTYVAILKDYGRDVTMDRPAGYDSTLFACCCDNPMCINPKEPDRVWPREKMITYGKLPNGKYMINWPIEGNDYYVNLIEMTPGERTEALKKAKQFTLCFVYFLQHQLGMNNLGLADDEYPTEDLLPFIPYHRESRRIHGKVRFNFNHISRPYDYTLYRTNIAVGDYPIDHHHTRYIGEEQLPNLYFWPVPSFGLPLGALVPQDIEDLIVAEKSISVSNIANGSTRLQPVVLQIGQAAGALAAEAVKKNIHPSEVSIRSVQNDLLEAGCYLQPYIDVPATSPVFKAYQRIGSTGILKGEGKNVGWSNITDLHSEALMDWADVKDLYDYYGIEPVRIGEGNLTADDLRAIVSSISADASESWKAALDSAGLSGLSPETAVTRGQYAVLIDALLDPFNSFDVDFQGNLVR